MRTIRRELIVSTDEMNGQSVPRKLEQLDLDVQNATSQTKKVKLQQ